MSPYEALAQTKKRVWSTVLPGADFMFEPAIEKKIHQKLIDLYGEDADKYMYRLQRRMAKTNAAHHPKGFSEKDAVVIAWADHVQSRGYSSLHTLHSFCREYLRGGINSIHILPFFPFTSDRGFSIKDYKSVHTEFGDWKDVKELSGDYKLMFDFVMNHTSTAHPWFTGYRARVPRYKDYYFSAHPRADISKVVRPRAHPLLTPRKTITGKRHVWTTFSEDQVDLNYANPQVLYEMLKILLFYVEKGAALIRLDAVGFAWKEIGTTSIHHKNTHKIVQLMRDVLDAVSPGVKIITETNVPHEENISYFGNGENEAQLVYNFSLPPLTLYSIQTEDATVLSNWAKTLSVPSDKTTFFNFTASHDGIGLRGAAGLLSDKQLNEMIKRVVSHGGRVSYKANPDGSTSPYEINSTYFDAVSGPETELDEAVDRFMLTQAVMLAIAGVPGIYLSSLLGARNWQKGYKRTQQNRIINEEKFQLDDINLEYKNLNSRTSKVFNRYIELLKIRKENRAFHPAAKQTILELSPQIFALARVSTDGIQKITALHNFSKSKQAVKLEKGSYKNLINGKSVGYNLELSPYEIAWLKTQ